MRSLSKAFLTVLPDESEVRYIWVDFEQDVACVEDDNLDRLRLTISTGDRGGLVVEAFVRYSNDIMESFTALRELHLAIAESFLDWGSTWPGPGYGGCPYENTRFFDLHTALLLSGPQLDMVYNWSWKHGGRVLDMDTCDEDQGFMIANYTGLDLSELLEIN